MAADYIANIRKMYLFTFLTSLGFIGGVLVPFFTDWGGITLAQIMFLQSWFFLWIFLCEVPTGAVADYLGRKHSLVLASVLTVAAVMVYASVPNFYVFLLGEILWGAANAFSSGAGEAFVYDTLKEMKDTEKSKEVFGRIASFGLAGVMIGAPSGSIIAPRFGLRAPVLLMAVPTGAALVIALTFKEPPITQKSESRQYFNILKSGVKYFYKNKILQVLALDVIFIGIIAYYMIWFYQPMLKQAGVDIIYFGVVHAVLAACQILIMNNYLKMERVVGSKRRLIFVSAAITGLMFIIGGLTNFVPIVLMVIVLGGGFGLSRGPLFDSYFNKHIPSEQRATVLSTIAMLETLVLVGANLVVGVLADWSLNNTLVILGLAALVFSFLSRVKEEHLVD